MDGIPSLAELEERIDVVDWYALGLQLKLNPKKLEAFRVESATVAEGRRKMFSCWLENSENPTRRELITKLNTHSVGQNRLAEEYECYVINQGETFITSTFSSRRYFMQVIRDYRFYCFILLFVAVVFAYNGLIPMTRKFLLPIAKQQTQTYESLEVSGKDVLYDSGSYLIPHTFGYGYAVHLRFLAPDYGRVILDLYNSDSGNVLQHNSMRYSGCGIYRESNVLVLNSQLRDMWGTVERPNGFHFLPGEKTSYIVAATESAYKISAKSGDSFFTYYYDYRTGTEPHKVDRIDTYIIEYRDCVSTQKGKVLQLFLGRIIQNFNVGTLISISAIAPSRKGSIIDITTIQGEADISSDSLPILHITIVSGENVPVGAKFKVNIDVHDALVIVSLNEKLYKSIHLITMMESTVTVWVSGVSQLNQIESHNFPKHVNKYNY